MPDTTLASRACITGIGVLTPFSDPTGIQRWPHLSEKQALAAAVHEPWPETLDPPFPGARLGRVIAFPRELYFTDRQLRLMDKAMGMSFVAAAFALEDAGLPLDGDLPEPDEIATVIASAQGESASLYRFGSPLLRPNPGNVNPAHFPMIARNVACGQTAIRLGIRGWSTMIAAGPEGGSHALQRAAGLIASGRSKTVIVGAFEVHSPLGLHQWKARWARRRQQGGQFAAGVNDWIPVEGACFFVLESQAQAARRGKTPYAEVEHGVHGLAPGPRGPGWPGVFDRFLSRHPAADGVRGAARVSCASALDGGPVHAAAVEALETTAASICRTGRSHRSRPWSGDAQSVNPLFAVAHACRLLARPSEASQVLVSSMSRDGAYALCSLRSAGNRQE